MSTLRYVWRQVRTDISVVLAVALVVGLGAAAGAAGPRWTESAISTATLDTLETGDTDLTLRQNIDPVMEHPDEIAEQVLIDEPTLSSVYPEARWTASIPESTIGKGPNHMMALRMPSDLDAVVRVTDGTMPSAAPSEFLEDEHPLGDDLGPALFPVIEVAISGETAEIFDLDVGDEAEIGAGGSATGGWFSFRIRVTGLFEPVDPKWAGWTENHAALEPWEETTPGGDRIYHAAALAHPAMIDQLMPTSPNNDEPLIPFPVEAEIIRASAPVANASGQLTTIQEAIRRLETGQANWLTELDDEIETFSGQYAASKRVTALGAMSVAALWVILLALMLRLLADRRLRALVVSRTRGATKRVLVRQLALEATVIAAPAAALGTLAGFAAMPEPEVTLSYLIPAGIAVLVVIALPFTGLALARQASPVPRAESPARVWRLRAAEGGVILTGAAAFWLLSSRTANGVSVDPLTSLAPVLIAVAAGLVVVRLIPLLTAAVKRLARAAQGSTVYLATHWSAQSRGTAVLPTIAMLVAIGLTAMSSAIDASAERTRDSATWADVPADIVASSRLKTDDTLDPDHARQLGADQVAAAYPVTSDVSRGGSAYIDPAVLAVDLDGWRSVTDRALERPEPVAKLSGDPSPPPAIVVGSFGPHSPMRPGEEFTIGDVPVQIAGVVPAFPGIAQTPTIVVATRDVPAQFDPDGPTALFVSGDFSVAAKEDFKAAYPDAVVQSRAEATAEIDADPLLAATLDIYRIVLVAAVVLAATAAAASLLVASPARLTSLSVLHTLGFSHRQAFGLIAAEVLPSAIVAAVVGVVTGTVVTSVAADALDLTALTATLGFTVPTVLDVATTITTALGIVAAVVGAVVLAVFADRPSRLGSALRIGE